jgi:hypothetical protein
LFTLGLVIDLAFGVPDLTRSDVRSRAVHAKSQVILPFGRFGVCFTLSTTLRSRQAM